MVASQQFSLLSITFLHLRHLGILPRRHRDPFDRMMIAQALAEGIPIATSDRVFASYGPANRLVTQRLLGVQRRSEAGGGGKIHAAVGGKGDAIVAYCRLAGDQPVGDIERDLLGIALGRIAEAAAARQFEPDEIGAGHAL